jgi:hypothetical protein
VAVCASNINRRGLIIQNLDAAGALSVGFGTGNAAVAGLLAVSATATSTQGGLAYGPFVGSLVMGPVQPMDTGKNSIPTGVPSGDVSVIATITNLKINVTEW